MGTSIETIKVVDKYGFIQEVKLEHKPHFGFSTAYHNENIIGQVELHEIIEPISDDDAEWERYQELFMEWSDEIKVNMNKICLEYFKSKCSNEN